MSENREAGWYWCKDSYGDDLPLYWCGERWLTSDDYSCDSAYLKQVLEVGDRIPTPDEPWQCVPVEATEGMLDEVCSAEGIKPWVPETMADTYRTMIDAAPKPGGE